jgi:hypothetical protein
MYRAITGALKRQFTQPHDIVGDVRTDGQRNKRTKTDERTVDGSQIDIEIFELGSPLPTDRPFKTRSLPY